MNRQTTKLITRFTATVIALLSFAFIFAIPAAAQTAPCPKGQIQVQIYGYGNTGCLPATPFTIGSLTIDNYTIMAMIVLFIAIFTIVINAAVIKNKLSK